MEDIPTRRAFYVYLKKHWDGYKDGLKFPEKDMQKLIYSTLTKLELATMFGAALLAEAKINSMKDLVDKVMIIEKKYEEVDARGKPTGRLKKLYR